MNPNDGSSRFQIHTLQMQCRLGDVPANLSQLAAGAQRAAARGAQLLVAPELCVTGYGAEDALRQTQARDTQDQLQALQAVADQHRMALVVGVAERSGVALYNCAALLRPGLAPVLYRKACLYGDYERGLFTPAPPSTCVMEHAGLRIGLLVCVDVEFPENVRRVAQAGAQLVAVPTALPAGRYSPFVAQQLVPVRAFENQVFLAYADHVGKDGRFAYAGLSCIAAPDGTRLAHADAHTPADLSATLSPADYADSAAHKRYLSDLGQMASAGHRR